MKKSENRASDTNPCKSSILIVDDKPANLFAMRKLLRQVEAEVIEAQSGMEALELALYHDFCVAIVDVQMPEMDGYELVSLLRSNEATSKMPVIFVSAIFSDEYHHQRGYEAGAVDFLSKPFIPEILLSKVRIFLDLCAQRCQLQTLVTQMNTANKTLSSHALQLEAVQEVAQQITSILELDALLPAVVQLIQSKFNYYYVGMWLHDDGVEGSLVLRAGAGHDGTDALPIGFTLTEQQMEGIVGHVCSTHQLYYTNNISTDSCYIPLETLPNTQSELTLPLQIGDKILGVLDIESNLTQAFDDEGVGILQSLASQVGIAIRNAQLYSQVTQFNEELETRVQERTAELQTANRHLELLDKNKSDFLQVVSHELRTPLTLIRGYGQLLRKHPGAQDDEAYQKRVEGIITGVARMHDIVNSMLDVIRIDTRSLQLIVKPVHVGLLLDQLVQRWQSSLRERHLTLTLHDVNDLPEIEADREALVKLFDQLISNAVKYTPDEGCIDIKGREIAVAGSDTFTHIEITINDTGIGISLEQQDLIFTKFYRTDDATWHSTGKTKFRGGGPGLGLAIAKGIVEAHGGKIWAESQGYDDMACPGSSFHVVLPITQPATFDLQDFPEKRE